MTVGKIEQLTTKESNINLDFKPFSEPALFNQMKPHRCPVCGGNGLVPNGFYSSTTGQWSTTSTAPETCRACSGKGYILA